MKLLQPLPLEVVTENWAARKKFNVASITVTNKTGTFVLWEHDRVLSPQEAHTVLKELSKKIEQCGGLDFIKIVTLT